MVIHILVILLDLTLIKWNSHGTTLTFDLDKSPYNVESIHLKVEQHLEF